MLDLPLSCGSASRVTAVGEMRNQGVIREPYITPFCVTGSIDEKVTLSRWQHARAVWEDLAQKGLGKGPVEPMTLFPDVGALSTKLVLDAYLRGR